jgi:methylase of polypeptide subunit release factors
VRRLAPFGILVLEMGYDQGDAVFHLCQHAGLSQIHILPDHDGKDRYVWGRL